jgi:alpha-pyrone synthase
LSTKTQTRIISIGTAVPKNEYLQSDLAHWMHKRLDGKDERLGRIFQALYRKTKIDKRYSVLQDFNSNLSSAELFGANTVEPKVEERLAIYDREAILLAKKAVDNCLQSFDTNKITHLITVSCTGMSAPGLEIKLKQKVGLNTGVQTHAVNFVGCYAFFPALKMADAFIKANSKAKVLIVAVELCTLHFQNKNSDDHLLSNSLFSDGAAACLCSAESSNNTSLKLTGTDQLLIPKGESDMAWSIHTDGFLMKLSSYIPQLVDEGIRDLIDQLLKPKDLRREDIKHWAVHPGGRKILEVCEDELKLKNDELNASYSTLKNFGNMSAPTILFVLKEIMQNGKTANSDQLFACGFGPGLTLEAALFEIERHA